MHIHSLIGELSALWEIRFWERRCVLKQEGKGVSAYTCESQGKAWEKKWREDYNRFDRMLLKLI